MKTPIPAVILVLVTAAATAAVTLPSVTAEPSPSQAPAAQAATAQAAPAQELVTGLPDFTRLVERIGPGVVSIEATIGGARMAQRGGPPQEMFPEIFRRFFGPGFPFPGGPDGPGGPDDPRETPRGISMGTGFLVSEDGYLLTNHHVVANALEVRVRLHDHRQFDAEVVGSDEQSDVAVLKIDADDLTVLRPGDAGRVRPGQWAVAIGSPFGLEQSVTAGIVSAVGRANRYSNQQYVPFIQTDVAINRGNSGGPLLNTRGEVIGINSQIFSNSGGYMGVAFAIPIDVAMNVVDQLKKTGRVQRGQLGVQFQATGITADQAKGFGLPEGLAQAIARKAGPVVLVGALDPRLAIPLVIWFIAYAGMLYYFLPRLAQVSAAQADARSDMTGRLVDTYTNISTVKLFSHSQREATYAREGMEHFLHTVYPQMRLATLLSSGVWAINALLIFSVSALSIWLWSENAISTGAIAAAVGLVLRLNGMAQWIMWEVSALFENIGTARDGLNTLSRSRDVQDQTDAVPLSIDQASIAFNNVSFHYGKSSGVIDDFSLNIQPNEKIGLVGRSGSGKSTLVNLLMRFYDVEGGNIFFRYPKDQKEFQIILKRLVLVNWKIYLTGISRRNFILKL